jgi:hypothetical protein
VNFGFWLGVVLVALLLVALALALRHRAGDPDLEWRGKDLRDLETGDHRKPRPPLWKRLVGRR